MENLISIEGFILEAVVFLTPDSPRIRRNYSSIACFPRLFSQTPIAVLSRDSPSTSWRTIISFNKKNERERMRTNENEKYIFHSNDELDCNQLAFSWRRWKEHCSQPVCFGVAICIVGCLVLKCLGLQQIISVDILRTKSNNESYRSQQNRLDKDQEEEESGTRNQRRMNMNNPLILGLLLICVLRPHECQNNPNKDEIKPQQIHLSFGGKQKHFPYIQTAFFEH